MWDAVNYDRSFLDKRTIFSINETIDFNEGFFLFLKQREEDKYDKINPQTRRN